VKREWLELAVATSAGVAAVPTTAATSPAVASATFACGIIAVVTAAVVSTITASGAALAFKNLVGLALPFPLNVL
jgi:hypothetical protein